MICLKTKQKQLTPDLLENKTKTINTWSAWKQNKNWKHIICLKTKRRKPNFQKNENRKSGFSAKRKHYDYISDKTKTLWLYQRQNENIMISSASKRKHYDFICVKTKTLRFYLRQNESITISSKRKTVTPNLGLK